MIILRISVVLTAIAAMVPVLTYNLHMLQLNGYKIAEHINWLCKNISRQWWLFLLVISGIFLCVAEGNVLPIRYNTKAVYAAAYIISLIVNAIVFIRYMDYRRKNIKKRLVYTDRIKRLGLTLNLINIISVISFAACTGEAKWIPAIIILLVGTYPIIMLIASVINLPIERSINSYYINDAKAMLKSMENLIVIGITGSYGKTSMKFYLNTLLREHFNVLMTPESYNTPMGIVRTVRERLRSTHEIFLCEMGARHVGDIAEVCEIANPTHGVITSIGPQHLETFFNIENIKKTKFELADYVSGRGKLFLNADNELIMEKAGEYKDIVFYQTKGDTKGYIATDIQVSNRGTEFNVTSPQGETERFNTRLIGEHNVINLVGAIAVANTLGISLKELRLPLRRIEPVPHRLQLIERGAVTIIDDAFNSNPIGSKAAVETLRMFSGIRILITPGMVELGDMEEEYNKRFGKYASSCCDYIILIGEKHTRPIYNGAVLAGFSKDRIKIFENIEEGINYAYTIEDTGHKYILLENDLPDNY